MRHLHLPLLLFCAVVAGWAQQSAEPGDVPPATSERQITGHIESGFRWLPGQAGSSDVYRSVVNLGEGPRVTGAELHFSDPGNRFLDQGRFTASAWGGDPYNTASLDAAKAGLYDFRLNYRNVAYFNSLPSFANPLLSRGLFFSQRALDMERRQLDTELRFVPDSWISPYVSYNYASGSGRGITTFVTDGNEFPVSGIYDDGLHSTRGGARMQFSKASVILEQGWTSYTDESRLQFNDGGHQGNRPNRLLGQELILNQYSQPYRATGEGLYQRGILNASPWSFLTFSGQFLYSQPRLRIRQDAMAAGNFLRLETLLPFSNFAETVNSEAQMPHTSASTAVEFRPVSRLRIIQSWFTDRFHIAGMANISRQFASPGTTATELLSSPDRLVVNYNQHQVEALFDVTRRLTVRGGHRYVWGNAVVRQPTLDFPGDQGAGSLKRNVALAGFRYRAGSRVTVSGDFEASPRNEVYFRTSLAEYQRGRARVSYQILPSLTWTSHYGVLNNQDSQPAVQYDFRSQEVGGSLAWTPNSGRRFSVLADYSYFGLRTSIPTVLPPFYQREVLRYVDHGHHGGAYADLNLSSHLRLNLGGSFSSSGGSRPVRFYQPQARVTAPVAPRLAFTGEWRWYGFTEPQFSFEHFRTHVVLAGFRVSLN